MWSTGCCSIPALPLEGPSGRLSTHPAELVSLRIHETPEEAMAAECANWNLWAGRLRDYDRVRGGRLNGVDPLRFAPRGWRPDTENTPP